MLKLTLPALFIGVVLAALPSGLQASSCGEEHEDWESLVAGSERIVEAEILDVSSSTSGTIKVEGNAKEIEATAATGGQIRAYELNADDVYAKANTGAEVRVSASERLKGSANTGGSIRYKGSPRADIRTNTGGSVRRSH